MSKPVIKRESSSPCRFARPERAVKHYEVLKTLKNQKSLILSCKSMLEKRALERHAVGNLQLRMNHEAEMNALLERQEFERWEVESSNNLELRAIQAEGDSVLVESNEQIEKLEELLSNDPFSESNE
jgi:hypothetical protein